MPKQNQVPGSHAIICDVHIVNNLSKSLSFYLFIWDSQFYHSVVMLIIQVDTMVIMGIFCKRK